MLDSYIWGVVERISPEAPVPIVNVKKKDFRLGGAANVALNILSLGANPVLCSLVGTMMTEKNCFNEWQRAHDHSGDRGYQPPTPLRYKPGSLPVISMSYVWMKNRIRE